MVALTALALVAGCQQDTRATPDTVLVESGGARLTQADVNQMIGLDEVLIGRRLKQPQREAIARWQASRFSADPYGVQMVLRTTMEWLREIDEASGAERRRLIETTYASILKRRVEARLTASGQSIPANAEAFAALADEQMKGFAADLKTASDNGDPWAVLLVKKPPLASEIETALVALHDAAKGRTPQLTGRTTPD